MSNFNCMFCVKTFNRNSNLKRHVKDIHNHLIIKGGEILKEFDNFNEFKNWKENEEKETNSSFVRKRGRTTRKNGDVVINYYCYRSGVYKPQGKGLRNRKHQDSVKIGMTCSAEMRAKFSNGRVFVNYFPYHKNHEIHVEHFKPTSSGKATNKVSEMLQAIVYKDGHLSILDQLLLPQKTHYVDLTSVQDGWNAIRSMQVRGAPAISIVAALSLAVDIQAKDFSSKEELHEYIVKSLHHLLTSRPTAVNLQQVVNLFTEKSLLDARKKEVDVEDMRDRIIACAEKLLITDLQINKDIGRHGGLHIMQNCAHEKPVVLTHCNTGSLATAGYGTALGVIRWLHENGHLEKAYCTETRPYNQGARLTAYELVYDKIPGTLICDDMVAALMDTHKITAVVVGADRVVANGDTANKIGTFQMAICAKYHGVPFYVAAPRSTLDYNLSAGSFIPIEERPHSEMTSINSIPIAAEGITCWNPAFDVTPSELITGGIITECGVFPANALEENQELLTSLQLF